MNGVNSEFGFFTISELNLLSERSGKLYMSIDITQMFSTMNHSQMTKKLNILNITVIFMYLYIMLLAHPI